ncbi:PBSX family phage terminase large subunit [Bacillus thuringiensis]
MPYLERPERFMVLYGGAGSGKSVFGVQRAVIKLLKDQRKMLVIRKVTNTIRESIFAEFKKILSQFKLLDECKVSESNFTIKLPNGSEFIFKGMDDPEKIKSISGIDDILIEEATELTLDDFSQLSLRLRSRKPNNQIVLMYNPVSKANWVYDRFHNPKTRSLENTIVIHTTYKDNKFLPRDYIDALHEMMKTNPTYFKIYALGEFASLGQLVFNNWQVAGFNPRHLLLQGHKAYFGLDFGYTNDPAAFVACIVDQKQKRIYVYDEFYKKQMLNSDIVDEITMKGFSKEVIIADSAEAKSIEEIKRSGIRRIKAARKGKDSILHGIQFIQQYEIIVHPNCKNFKMELENYAWEKDKKTNEHVNRPIDNFNHLMDAFRYSLEEVMPRNRIKTISKAMLGF